MAKIIPRSPVHYPIGVNTMFLQIGKRYAQFLALHQFFHTLPIIWAQVAIKHFLLNPR
jgi:hypothetical protein